MSHTLVKEGLENAEAVVLAYTEERSSKRAKSSTRTKKADSAEMDIFDRKATQMEAMLDKFPAPSRK